MNLYKPLALAAGAACLIYSACTTLRCAYYNKPRTICVSTPYSRDGGASDSKPLTVSPDEAVDGGLEGKVVHSESDGGVRTEIMPSDSETVESDISPRTQPRTTGMSVGLD